MSEEFRAQAVQRVVDVLAPVHEDLNGERIPIFEWGHETTPSIDEVTELAGQIVDALGYEPGTA